MITRENPTVYLPTGDPDTESVATLQHPGDLGRRFPWHGSKWYRKVKCDSGTTSLTPSGVVAVRQLAYWKDRDQHLVTNDIRFAESNRNCVAGIFRNSVTAGHYTNVLTEDPNATAIDDEAAAFVKGDLVIPSGTSTKVTRMVEGTAPTHRPIGEAIGPSAATILTFRLHVPDIE